MISYLDIKILAESKEEAQEIVLGIISKLELNSKIKRIEEYPKFSTPLYTVLLESTHANNFKTEDFAKLFKRIGEPIFEDICTWIEGNKTLESYEALFDARKHISSFPEIFWALLYVDKKSKLKKIADLKKLECLNTPVISMNYRPHT